MNEMFTVGIVATGVANFASVNAALLRAGVRPMRVDSPSDIQSLECVVLPGVGAFGAAMEHLGRLNLITALRERIARGRPTLAICLGLQLFGRESEESPGVEGLRIWDSDIRRIRATRVPQLGWNFVRAPAQSRFVRDGYAYFANSYALRDCPDGWHASWNTLDEPCVATAERGAVLACQFHPELSGPWGDSLLRRWLESAKRFADSRSLPC